MREMKAIAALTEQPLSRIQPQDRRERYAVARKPGG